MAFSVEPPPPLPISPLLTLMLTLMMPPSRHHADADVFRFAAAMPLSMLFAIAAAVTPRSIISLCRC
jgi:hypothetical protein